jgi:hypothetical protein
VFNWTINGTSLPIHSAKFETDTLTKNAVIGVEMISNATCANPLQATATIQITVKPIKIPSIKIKVNNNDVCAKTAVILDIDSQQNQGANPKYSWYINNTLIASNNTQTISIDTLTKNARVKLELENNEMCVNPTKVSSEIEIRIIPYKIPSIALQSLPAIACEKTLTSFMAINVLNEGLTPQYTWYVNGSTVNGSTSIINCDTLSGGAKVTVEITSSEQCVFPLKAQASIFIKSNPKITITTPDHICKEDAPIIINVSNSNGQAGNFAIQSSLGVQKIGTNYMFLPSAGVIGANAITADWTDNNGCKSSLSKTITVHTIAPPTVPLSYSNIIGITPYVNFEATGIGNIRWYNDAKQLALQNNNIFTPNKTCSNDECEFQFYVNQTDKTYGCASDTVPILYTLTTCPVPSPIVKQDYFICDYETVPNLEIDTAQIWEKSAPIGASELYWYAQQNSLTSAYITLGKTYTPPVSLPGNYVYWVRQYNSGYNCYSPAVAVSMEIFKAAIPTIAKPTLLVCNGVSPYPSFTSAEELLWYNSSNVSEPYLLKSATFTPDISISSSHNFYATRIENGCESKPAKVTLEVLERPTAPEIIDSTEKCEDEQQIIFASIGNNEKVEWFNEQGIKISENPNFSIDKSWVTKDSKTKFTAISLSKEGCISDTTKTQYEIVSLPPVPNLIGNDVICIGADSQKLWTNSTPTTDSIVWLNENALRIYNGTEYSIPDTTPQVKVYKAYAYHKVCKSKEAGIKEVELRLRPTPQILGNTTFCEFAKANAFYIQMPNDSSTYQWDNTGNYKWYTLNNSKSRIYIDLETATFDTVSVIETDAGGCSNTDTITFKVSPYPVADFEFSTASPQGEIYFENTSTEAQITKNNFKEIIPNSYFWEFDTNAQVNNQKMEFSRNYLYGYYLVSLFVENSFGCKDSISYTIFSDVTTALYVPTAFAPTNSAHLVKVFKPMGMSLSTYEINIYDSWGNTLWYSNKLTEGGSPAEGWDGMYNGEILKSDIYIWKIKATFVDGTTWNGIANKNFGNIMLIR